MLEMIVSPPLSFDLNCWNVFGKYSTTKDQSADAYTGRDEEQVVTVMILNVFSSGDVHIAIQLILVLHLVQHYPKKRRKEKSILMNKKVIEKQNTIAVIMLRIVN